MTDDDFDYDPGGVQPIAPRKVTRGTDDVVADMEETVLALRRAAAGVAGVNAAYHTYLGQVPPDTRGRQFSMFQHVEPSGTTAVTCVMDPSLIRPELLGGWVVATTTYHVDRMAEAVLRLNSLLQQFCAMIAEDQTTGDAHETGQDEPVRPA